ncbi:FAD-dependent oxidoreductase [Sorangium sp. So ce260]|uniref:FAD-dependent oxidoreductase n=1 Tax=Sorangium sp. So ce260 TaxID=3133291 RepID=UPI003F6414AC
MIAAPPVDASLADSPPTSPLTILRHMTVPVERGLYVLGSFEGRVTIYSQQIRALNLIHALWTTGALADGRRLAIIGGGIAGITAALGAACKNVEVTLYERQPEVLHLMRGCHTRWVHPTIYDWPKGDLPASTNLPFLSWEAASAGDVTAKLADEWKRLKSVLRIREVTGATVALGPSIDGRRRVFTTSPGFSEDDYHIVILAVGFGVERSIAPHPLRSYWRDDALHQPEIGASGPVHSLVSGSGDGGLTDLLRLRLREFKHGSLLNELISMMDSERLRNLLEPIEDEAWNLHERGEEHGAYLHREYRNKFGAELVGAVDDRIRRYLRYDTRVTFNFPEWPFTLFFVGTQSLPGLSTSCYRLRTRYLDWSDRRSGGRRTQSRCPCDQPHGRACRTLPARHYHAWPGVCPRDRVSGASRED